MRTEALLLVDVQVGFSDTDHWGPRNNPGAEANIRALLEDWRHRDAPVVLVQHDSVEPNSPLRPGQPGNALQPWVEGPAALHVRKTVNSAFIGTPDLDAWLRAQPIDAVAICGITTNHCCETTARMAANLGYRVRFVLDATYTHDRIGPDGDVHRAEAVARMTAANLHGEFAHVVRTADVLGA
ncbi:MAG: cysteine hydrolase family protein [Myxococcota bacterium]